MSTNSIVVGYDASEGAEAALDWAVDESERTATPVTLVYAVVWRTVPGPIGLAPSVWPDASAWDAAEKLVAAAVARVRESRPGLAITGTVVRGNAAAILIERSRDARMVVLGSHGHGGFAGLLVGSTSVAVTAHAHSPVVVVRGETPPAGAPVVVGFDGSDAALLAVDFAFAEAARRRTSLRIIQAAPPPRRQPPGYDLDEQLATERAELSDFAASWQDKYPTVRASVHLIDCAPAEVLVAASHGARLVVVGSRGRGGFSGLLLGSVSQQLLYHAHCPVAVVRELPA